MTNEIKAGKMQIMKCDQCQDGYLIIKPGKNDYFLGCTNYKSDGSGCNNVISKEKYYEIYSLTPDRPIVSAKGKKRKDHNNSLEIKVNDGTSYEKRIYDLDNPEDFYSVTKIIISCVEHVSQIRFFGTKKIVDILFGIEPENTSKMNLKKLPEFGTLVNCERIQIRATMMAMLKYNLLLQTKERYPVLHPTNEGKEYSKSLNKEAVKKIIRVYKLNLGSLLTKEEEDQKDIEKEDENTKIKNG
jgi:DNA helicase-4